MDRRLRMRLATFVPLQLLCLSLASPLSAAPAPAPAYQQQQLQRSHVPEPQNPAEAVSQKLEGSSMPTDMLRGKAVVDVVTNTKSEVEQQSDQEKTKAATKTGGKPTKGTASTSKNTNDGRANTVKGKGAPKPGKHPKGGSPKKAGGTPKPGGAPKPGVPKESPTKSPSKNVSPTPTKSPTPATRPSPTKSPTPTKTSTPAKSPTPAKSHTPAKSPTPAKSSSPTTSPSPSTSPSPAKGSPTGSPAPKGGSQQWNGQASPDALKDSMSRINMFLAVIKGKGKYNSFMGQLNNTGLIASLANLLPFFGITVMVPSDQAWAQLTPAQWQVINSKPEGVLQLVAFHCFFPAFSGTDLTNMPPGTAISTADYPQRGNRAFKLNTTTTMFNGQASDQVGAYVNDNSIYYDYFGKYLLIAHGISSVMMPAQFYDP